MPLLLLLLLSASSVSAATLCVSGTLAAYDAAHYCDVDAGLGVFVRFTFDDNTFIYHNDLGTFPLSASDIQVTPVGGVNASGRPDAGLQFSFGSTPFTVPSGGVYADINLTFDAEVLSQPRGFLYKFSSAHLALDDTTAENDAIIMIAERDTLHSAFLLSISDPDDSEDVADANYALQSALEPNINVIVTSGAEVNSWTQSFDLTNVPEPGSLAFIPGGLILIGLLRNTRRWRRVLPLLGVLVLFAAKSHATALCTDLNAINGAPTGQASLFMSQYISYGACTMNDMIFQFTGFSQSGAGLAKPSAADTTVIFTLNNHTGSATDVIGIQYVPVALSSTSQSQTFSFSYTVTAPLYRITQLQSVATASVTGSAGITHTLTVSPGATPSPAVGSAMAAAPMIVTLADPLNTTISVTEKFDLTGTGVKHLSGLDERFTEAVPEPLTSLLMGSALLSIGLLGRKLRHK